MKKIGKNTIQLDKKVYISSAASIVGPKESEGPLKKYFDLCLEDEFWGEKTWEKSESKFIKEATNMALTKSNIAITDIDICFAGDLLNQCISSCFGLRAINIPFFGIFGACSTFIEALALGSIFISGGASNNVLCATSSHFCSAEKQFRFPLELGNQRPQTSQWTVTGAGAAILSNSCNNSPYITYVTPGSILDMGIKDANNMGAAMAMAAVNTITTHFKDTGRSPNFYDLIVTGDLGYIGKEIVLEQTKKEGYFLNENYNDCGVLIFDKNTQDTHAGGSGCACIATVFSSYIMHLLQNKKIKNVLLIGTGALTNSTTTAQGESIPSIAHAISIEFE